MIYTAKKNAMALFALLLVLLITACSPGGNEHVPEQEPAADEVRLNPNVEVLTYATVIKSSGLRDKVDQFNRAHTDIQIVIKEYSGDTYEESLQSYDRFLTELAAGEVPDIIGGSVPYHLLARKGYLENLWPYIESDPDLGRENVMEAPLRAAGLTGELYCLFDSVDIMTLTGRAGVVGDRTSWTLGDLRDALASMPTGSTVLEQNANRSQAEMLLEMTLENYVDWETGECSFDCPGFRSALEFLKSFPESVPPSGGLTAQEAFDQQQAAQVQADEWLASGRQMLEWTFIRNIGDIQILDVRHGGRCAFVGYPVEDGSVGSCFDLPWERTVGISSTCKNKEAAWEFLRAVLMGSVNLQDGIPVYRPYYDTAKASYMSKSREECIYLSQALEPWVALPALTEEQCQRFEDFFYSIDKIRMVDNGLTDLVLEVSGPYFAGAKTLDETVDMLQNRVGLYVNENR